VRTLTRAAVQEALDRHADGRLSAAALSAWAERHDAAADVHVPDDVVKQCLFELSSPELTGMTLPDLAAEWRVRLRERT
jgi:hypothetical protein